MVGYLDLLIIKTVEASRGFRQQVELHLFWGSPEQIAGKEANLEEKMRDDKFSFALGVRGMWSLLLKRRL